jgi:hypothetical protein
MKGLRLHWVVLRWVGTVVGGLLVWFVVVSAAGSVVSRLLPAEASGMPAEVQGNRWIYAALVSHPLGSIAAGLAAGLLATRRAWLSGLVAGGVPVLLVVLGTQQFVAFLVPQALGARYVGCLISLALAALAGAGGGRLSRLSRVRRPLAHADGGRGRHDGLYL